MNKEKVEGLIQNLRRLASHCGKTPPADIHAEMMIEAANTLEEMKRHMETRVRDFTITTPLGDLRVYAKHEVDNPDDYPGVFVDIVNPQGDGIDDLLFCVEYDTVLKGIFARVYADGDEPSDSIWFENLEG